MLINNNKLIIDPAYQKHFSHWLRWFLGQYLPKGQAKKLTFSAPWAALPNKKKIVLFILSMFLKQNLLLIFFKV